MNGYSVSIKEVSKELTAREKIMLKDTSNAIKLDSIVNDTERATISPAYYAVLQIHNEKSERPDYENYMIVDDTGTKYVTGSPSFWSAFKDIFDEMKEVDEPYCLEVYKLDSKNYKGKQFLTCSII